MKKLVCLAVLLIFGFLPAYAGKTIVEITPLKKFTTANNKVAEGNYVDFKVVGTDKIVRGLIVDYQENGFWGQEAVVVLDKFHAVNSKEKYEGTIELNGNQHNGIMEFEPLGFWGGTWVRGGEITIKPNKDIVNLWRID